MIIKRTEGKGLYLTGKSTNHLPDFLSSAEPVTVVFPLQLLNSKGIFRGVAIVEKNINAARYGEWDHE